MAKKSDPTHVNDLTPDPKNARRHPDRNVEMIASALREVGAARSIVLDENNVVLAGNGVLKGAAAAGITKVKVIEADGDTIVAVKRRNLTPDQKARLALFDNRTAELAEWDADILRQLADDGIALGGLFTGGEFASLVEAQAGADAIEPIGVEKPPEVAWLLLAIPLASWPENQALVEQLQNAAVFQSIVLRPKDGEAKK